MFDYVGVLVLVVLAVFLGFLVTRAWKVKNAFLKWGGVVIGGLLTLIPTALLALSLIGFYKLNQHFDNPVTEVKVAGTPEQIARGQKLANICAGCHSASHQLPLSGNDFVAENGLPPIGTLYAPNLTPGGNISDWTDGELIRAIREGVHKNGRSLLVMPAENFRNMSDDDVQAVVAYLRSQPATGQPTPTNQFNLLGALFINLADFRTAQQPVGSVTAPQPGTPEYGKYLVDIIGCRSCHGPQLQGRDPNAKNGPPPGPNLTKVVPQWTEDQFMTFFNTGQLPSSQTIGAKMPWQEVRAVASDAELKDIYTYVHGLPVVEGPAK